jgi:hypothetical protein
MWNQTKLIPSQVHERCLIQTGTKPLCNDKGLKDMAIVNKQRSKSNANK